MLFIFYSLGEECLTLLSDSAKNPKPHFANHFCGKLTGRNKFVTMTVEAVCGGGLTVMGLETDAMTLSNGLDTTGLFVGEIWVVDSSCCSIVTSLFGLTDFPPSNIKRVKLTLAVMLVAMNGCGLVMTKLNDAACFGAKAGRFFVPPMTHLADSPTIFP